jgi:predicted RNA binding protein YcfA (HicA-like mRNA interferase family)
MQKLPILSGAELIKYLKRKGFIPVRQRGSHVLLKSSDGRRVTVPMYDELDRGLLSDILAEIGISKEEFLNDW